MEGRPTQDGSRRQPATWLSTALLALLPKAELEALFCLRASSATRSKIRVLIRMSSGPLSAAASLVKFQKFQMSFLTFCLRCVLRKGERCPRRGPDRPRGGWEKVASCLAISFPSVAYDRLLCCSRRTVHAPAVHYITKTERREQKGQYAIELCEQHENVNRRRRSRHTDDVRIVIEVASS